MSTFSAGGSTPITRIKNGDTLYFRLDCNGNPLYQAVDTMSQTIKPNWEIESNQPVITPACTSATGNKVTLSDFTWYYNGTAIAFHDDVESGWTTSTNFEGKFKLNVENGSLKIVKNLADANNPASDTLRCDCTAQMSGEKFDESKSVTVLIQPMSSGAYMGFVTASPTNLSPDVSQCTLTCVLYNAGDKMEESAYTVKWYKASDTNNALGESRTLTVGKNDVNHLQLFICDFYLTSTGNKCATAGICITDMADTFEVGHIISGTLGASGSVIATAAVYKSNTREIYDISSKSPTWNTGVYAANATQSGGNITTLMEPQNTNVINISAEDLDKGGTTQMHAYVYSEVAWTETGE